MSTILEKILIIMKKAIALLIIVTWIMGCENQEVIFPDFEYTTIYFPLQTPLRTLSLGEDRVNNQLDRELKFDIGVSIGGLYKNEKEWTVDYIVDNSLLDSAYNSKGEKLLALPSSYYTLNPTGTVTIPSGSFNGLIRIQLTEAFLDDSLALTGRYVIPLTITGTSADSILSGQPGIPNPDRRVVSDYLANMAPKNWTLFGIKYYNAYHGKYLQRGMDIRYLDGTPIDTVIYRTRDVEKNQIRSLFTKSKISATTNFIGNNTSSDGENSMQIEFSNRTGNSGSIEIKPVEGANFAVSGTGQFFDRSETQELMLGLKHQSMYLAYNYIDGIYTHQVKDTLVFLDRDIRFEEFSLVIR